MSGDVVASCDTLILPLRGTRMELPFARHVAAAALVACVADEDTAADCWLETLQQDSAFCLWASVMLRFDERSPAGLRDLADQLASRWHYLSWQTDCRDNDHGSDQWQRWSAIGEQALWVACRTAETAEPSAKDSLAFLSLVHVAPLWAAAGAVETESAGWPAWLETILAGQPLAADEEAARQLVNSAAAEWCDPSMRNSRHFEPVEAHRRYWQVDSHRTPALPALAIIGRLAEARLRDENYDLQLRDEKLAAMKELAYGASHEINNPLANISFRVQKLLPDEVDPERKRMLATINSQAFRANEMISDMMLFAKPPRLKLEMVDLVDVVGRVFEELQFDADQQGTQLLFTQPATSIIAHADRVHLTTALKAMGVNSLQALAAGGEIRVELGSCSTLNGSPALSITVCDTGQRMSERVRRHLFDPFFSGREAGRGLGFGLCKCWRIVTEHGGQISVESDDQGSRFEILLPQPDRDLDNEPTELSDLGPDLGSRRQAS